MSFFASLIPVRTTLKIVKGKLEEEINVHNSKWNLPLIKVNDFNCIIDLKENKISFVVEKRTYPYNDNGKFVNVVKDLVADKIKGHITLVLVIVNYTEKTITADVAYLKEDGSPERENLNLDSL